MDEDCLKNAASQCWVCSYNEAAKLLGLDSPICLGHLDMLGKDEYFWYNDEKCIPVFRNADARAILFMRFVSMTQILPASYFPRGAKLFYYSDDNLQIYQIANYLNIKVASIYASFQHLNHHECAIAKISSKNAKDEITAWIFRPIADEGEEWKTSHLPITAIPVFEKDIDALDYLQKDKVEIHCLQKGDYVIHGEDLYQMELHPQYGVALIKQEIDLNSLLKS